MNVPAISAKELSRRMNNRPKYFWSVDYGT
jgi:hypothetical protein